MIQERFETGMYIIDGDFNIINTNEALLEMYPEIKAGQKCYRALAMRDSQCEVCPLLGDNSVFYNPIRREWINANAAKMEYPGHGTCYNVQFHIRKRSAAGDYEPQRRDVLDEHIKELSGGAADACVIASYSAPYAPLAYANSRLIELLGYDSLDDLRQGIDGLVANVVHPDDLERITKELTRCSRHGEGFESAYRVHRKDNTWLWVVGRGKRVERSTGEFLLLFVVTDMTEFARHQNELREQNERLVRQELTSQEVLERMPGGYHRCANAPGFPLMYAGRSFEAITGWTKEEIEAEFGNMLINMVLPEDVPLFPAIIESIDETGYSNAVYRVKRKGGGYIWVSGSTTRVDAGGESFYHGVIADITDYVDEMEEAKQEAENSSRAKSTFLFNVSHDIRTPMNAIQGFAYMLEQHPGDPQLVKDAVHKILKSSKTLMSLINDVLELSRIERGKEELNRQAVCLKQYKDSLFEMFAADMRAAQIEFCVEGELVHANVICDLLKLTRIGMNMLSNAKKFTPAGGSVTLGVEELGDDGTRGTYRIYVRDTGIGMSEEFQTRAFEQFEQERSSTNSGVSGSGLGLAIIKRLVELMGGECSIESELGRGTEISAVITLSFADGETAAAIEGPLELPDMTGKRVLVVEDNEFNREIAKYVLESMGFEAEEAENGAVAVSRLLSAKPGYYDLVLMDIQMPVMDGYTATKEIRSISDPRIASVPIIAMTANAFEEDRRRCLETGMDGHIGKPLEAQTVLGELSRVFGSSF